MLLLEDVRIHHVGPVSLYVGAGECAGISGPSGTGKSILFRAVSDMEPFTGSIHLEGADIRETPAPLWRKQVGLLPAESSWWHDLVAPHFPATFSPGYAALGFPPEVAKWEIHRLSSGEKQRLSLLRLLANTPRVLLLDEPTANLDAENTWLVESIIQEYRIRHQAAVIWVSHDTQQLERVADHRYILDAGRLREACGPREA